MKIGIITMYYQNYNYGGQLQAYALCNALVQQKNEAVQISFDLYGGNFADKCIGRFRRNYKNIFSPQKLIKAYKESKIYNENYIKYMNLYGNNSSAADRFREFMTDIPHTEYVNTRTIKKFSDSFDLVVLGGDQIWNPQFINSVYFGKWVGTKTKVITYSVSGGKDIYGNREKKAILKSSKNIDSISVRENNLYQILKNHYGKEKNVELVLDPVFLLSMNQWKRIAIDFNYPEKYIFAYLLNKDSLSRSSIKAFAKKHKLSIITIPHARGVYNSCDEEFGDVQVLDAGPLEFIGYIKNALFIFTDSFHGTCFSLIMHKNFYVIENIKDDPEIMTNERMRTVLELAGAKDRLIKTSEVERLKNVKDIDYTYVDCLLKSEIEKSKVWLQEALSR